MVLVWLDAMNHWQTKLGFGARPATWALNVNVNVGGPQQIFVQQDKNGVVNIGAPAAQEPAPAAQARG